MVFEKNSIGFVAENDSFQEESLLAGADFQLNLV